MKGRWDRNSRGGTDPFGAGAGGYDSAAGGRTCIVARRDSADERDHSAAEDRTHPTASPR